MKPIDITKEQVSEGSWSLWLYILPYKLDSETDLNSIPMGLTPIIYNLNGFKQLLDTSAEFGRI